MTPDTSLRIRDNVYSAIRNIPELQKFRFFRFYDFYREFSDKFLVEPQFDRIVIQFTSLDSLAEFTEYLKGKHSLQIEMGEIQVRKNYNFISKLTGIISFILIMFGILCICLFVSNLLEVHLQKIKMNIGTFSAFGIDPKVLDRVYLSIILIFILAGMLLGLIFAGLIGYIGGIRAILGIMKSNLEAGWIYFDLLNWWTAGTMIAVIFMSVFTLKNISRKVFYQTPGDLIYDRDEPPKSKIQKSLNKMLCHFKKGKCIS